MNSLLEQISHENYLHRLYFLLQFYRILHPVILGCEFLAISMYSTRSSSFKPDRSGPGSGNFSNFSLPSLLYFTKPSTISFILSACVAFRKWGSVPGMRPPKNPPAEAEDERQQSARRPIAIVVIL